MSLLSRIAVEAARGFGMLASTGSPTNVSASYLVVAGGGGGGASSSTAGSTGGAGGGGAGGFLASTVTLSTLNTYSITVGAGGNGSTSQSATGSSGSNSVLSGTGLSTITSTGGGGGGSVTTSSARNGLAGGSGGGGGATAGVNGTGGSGTSGQGSAGGNGLTDGVTYDNGGGGGGASAVGSNATSAAGGNGGAGTSSSISGSSVTYAGGGGGSAYPLKTQGTGGAGGGGNSGSAGTANRGGGGGGGIGSGNAGGSGIVIISYTSATPKFVGGTITTSGGNQIHTFTSSGTLSPITPITASYLVVAGGGGGGRGNNVNSYAGGGGGAGGYQASSTTLYSGATYVVTVGGGGAGSTSTSNKGSNGSDSILSGTGLTTLTSVGGGGGGSFGSGAGANGGSGGGAASPSGAASGGTGTSGQGNAGGSTSGFVNYGAGGGGASAVGGNQSGSTSGAGGNGTASSISGTSTTYAGGGGGGGIDNAGTGGTGGGGTGGTGSNVGVSGTTNLGGGGGAGANSNGGSGGSGVVIISYAGSQVFNGGVITSSGGNTIHTFTSTGALTPLTNNLNNSLRFRSSATAYLNRTPTVAGNRQTFTYSGWVKRGALGSVQTLLSVGVTTASNPRVDWQFNASNSLEIDMNSSGTSWDCLLTTTQVFRDPSAWYHIVVAVDTTQATTANRVKLYVNGNQVTSFSSSTYPAQNASMPINNTLPHALGGYIVGASQYVDGYMTDINFIDGQALEPYYFGNNDANQVWKPIQYKGTYGTNGFYLTFGNTTSTTTLGYDSSPNGNNWTCNNISLTAGTTYDAMLDVPTNTSATVANYCVGNPLYKPSTQSTLSSRYANLDWGQAATNSVGSVAATMAMTSGKYYWEVTIGGSFNQSAIGIQTITETAWRGSGTVLYGSSGNKIIGGSSSAYGATYTTNDVLGFAYDADAGTLVCYKNNTSQGTIYSGGAGNSWLACIHDDNAGAGVTYYHSFNFGQRPFSYTPPTGYVALNTYNLPTPTILQGNKYMDATTYTGTGTSQVIVNQALFKPDLVWVKQRNGTQDHYWFDSIRGATVYLTSTSTNGDNTVSNTLTSFNSNGYSGGGNSATNGSALTYVGWQWQAGQGTTSSNTSGSITSTVSVNTTAGFSVVTYTGNNTSGATVGHGLGVAPKMVIVKNRSTTTDWGVYHSSLSANNTIWLNLTNAQQAISGTGQGGISATSSTTFTCTNGTTNGIVANGNGNSMVAYCWAEIAQFSKFGSYTGNGSTDGPFVYTGFRPKFVMLKRTDTTGNWIIYDSSRNTYNVVDLRLIPNTSDAEATVTTLDFLSNGFKLRTSDIDRNASGGTYIYAAFAENPFKNSNAR